jgi:hypothetical protein
MFTPEEGLEKLEKRKLENRNAVRTATALARSGHEKDRPATLRGSALEVNQEFARGVRRVRA